MPESPNIRSAGAVVDEVDGPADAQFAGRQPAAPARSGVARPGLSGANPYGLGFALGGLAVGFLLAAVATSVFDSVTKTTATSDTFGGDLTSLGGLWVGLVGAAVLAVRARPGGTGGTKVKVSTELATSYGLSIRLWPDLPLGIALGIGAQFLLVPLLELPLLPFVPHLFHRLGQPARSLTVHVHGGGLIVLALLVCVGSPIVEELFFRGLLLRSLLGAFCGPLGRSAIPVAVVLVGIVFGLAHFEALQLIALAGFGILLGALATATGRLGPGIVTHASFNAVTFISLALIRP